MKCTLVGSRFFGATVLDTLLADSVDIVRVVAPAADDRLALAAKKAGLEVVVLENPRNVPGSAIADDTDLIIAAHTHARVSADALARSRLGGIGYHPSLLPRHRGIAAVEWTILERDTIAGGSVYHLAEGMDAGALAAQDWCFVRKGETARELWERALAPMGLALLRKVVGHAKTHGELPARPQDEQFATKAPMLRRAAAPAEAAAQDIASLVVTVVGPDRPGIVSLLSDRAQEFGANWAESRMASLAGEFAGMVHLEVPSENAEPLAAALRQLEAMGLAIVIAMGERAPVRVPCRLFRLELVGQDRPGIMRELSVSLADRGVSIEELQTEITSGAMSAEHLFKVNALLLVPDTLAADALRRGLEALANEFIVDIAPEDGTAMH
jgi:methionyl-tRNA formyltransferase